jgi:Flp pilus assembly protein TadG
MRKYAGRRRFQDRHASVAVEAALIMPLMVTLMFGVWEMGRIIHVSEVLANAAREGARCAAGGTINGTPVTVATVDQVVKSYLTGSGLPAAAVSGAQITIANLSSNPWTDPVDAKPLDRFSVTVTIPAGAPFNSLKYTLVNQITTVNSISSSVVWQSLTDKKITVDMALPY